MIINIWLINKNINLYKNVNHYSQGIKIKVRHHLTNLLDLIIMFKKI